MSFQHEEQEFDFNYVFEYNQDVQNEPETGGYSRAMEGFFYLLYVLYIAECGGTAVYWAQQEKRLHKSVYFCVKRLSKDETFSILLTKQKMTIFIIIPQ